MPPIDNENEIDNSQVAEVEIHSEAEAEPANPREAALRAIEAQRERGENEGERKEGERKTPVNAGDKRQRDATGRFIDPKAGEAAQTDQARQAAAQADPAAVLAEQAAAQAGHRPPSSWDAASKAAFGQLPPQVQAAVAKREAEVENGFRVLQNYRGLEQYQGYMDQAGITHSEVMRRALDWEKATLNDPIGAVRHLLQIRGIDPRQAAQALATGQNINVPRPAAPQPKTVNIAAEVNRVIQEREVNSQIDNFLADPANTHANMVIDHMAALIQGGQARDLPSAYQMAIWANPEIRATLIRQGQAQPANGGRAAQAANQARQAAKGVTGAPARGATPQGASAQPKSAREAGLLAIAAQQGR